jgi:hypothetical protein
MFSYSRHILALAAVLLCAGCLSLNNGNAKARQLPLWVTQPKSPDSVYAYVIGSSRQQPSMEPAKEQAFHDALVNVFKAIMAGVTLAADESEYLAAAEIKGAEMIPDCLHFETTEQGIDCWIQVSYPLAERARILGQYEAGKPLRAMWESARIAYAKGDFQAARSNSVEVISRRTAEMLIPFAMDDVKMLAADASMQQKDFLEARRWYESLAKLSGKEAVREKASVMIGSLPQAPRFWPMNDRFGGQKVALVCGIREGKGCEAFGDLTGIMSSECREAGLPFADISNQLGPEAMGKLFDQRDLTGAVKAAIDQQAGVILALLMDVDPEKRALARSGASAENVSVDTLMKYMVISVSEGVCIYDGSIKEIAGSTSDAAVAAHAVAVLIQKYLVPKCPAVGVKTSAVK